jgi:hypothetical protein
MLTLTFCPEPSCGATAEITARYALRSSDGPIEHVSTYCVRQHRFVLPTERLAAAGIAEPRAT